MGLLWPHYEQRYAADADVKAYENHTISQPTGSNLEEHLEEEWASHVDDRAEHTSSSSFADVIIAVERASKKLEPFDPLHPSEAEVVAGLEAALLLTRSSSRLLQLLADQLEADGHD